MILSLTYHLILGIANPIMNTKAVNQVRWRPGDKSRENSRDILSKHHGVT